MSDHTANLLWTRNDQPFAYESYSRDHQLSFDNGGSVMASAAPSYLGSVDCIDPEEMLVASLSSCHMLTFLAIAAKRGYTVDRYEDAASGLLEKNEQGRLSITRVTLHPQILFSGDKQPDADELARLHDKAHENCFIANSVRASVVVVP